MCYAYKPVQSPAGQMIEEARKEALRLQLEGVISRPREGFFYAKDTVAVTIARETRLETLPMRWDLVPAVFMRREKPTLSEAIKAKNSRARDSRGFSSYNARLETVPSLWAFKDAWRAGKRGLMPMEAFKERPNMEGAPREFTGREYEVSLEESPEPHFLAALFDTWEGRDGEKLDSCTVITGPSDGIPALRAIWHERTPILLSGEAAEAWLDPATSPEAAYALLRGAPAPALKATEIPRKQG